jgi:hypothetical protein
VGVHCVTYLSCRIQEKLQETIARFDYGRTAAPIVDAITASKLSSASFDLTSRSGLLDSVSTASPFQLTMISRDRVESLVYLPSPGIRRPERIRSGEAGVGLLRAPNGPVRRQGMAGPPREDRW